MEDDTQQPENVSYTVEITTADGHKKFSNVDTNEDLMRILAACAGGFILTKTSDYMVVDLRKTGGDGS